jgi:hypothetical protein
LIPYLSISAKDKPVYNTNPYFTFTLTFSFFLKINWGKMQLERQFALFPGAVECPVAMSVIQTHNFSGGMFVSHTCCLISHVNIKGKIYKLSIAYDI